MNLLKLNIALITILLTGISSASTITIDNKSGALDLKQQDVTGVTLLNYDSTAPMPMMYPVGDSWTCKTANCLINLNQYLNTKINETIRIINYGKNTPSWYAAITLNNQAYCTTQIVEKEKLTTADDFVISTTKTSKACHFSIT